MEKIDYLASRGIASGMDLDGYGKLYYQTNENLIDTYIDTDFNDKDVFSVLASSDQVFTCQFLGAKSVDSFDINALAIYYYYLRLWSIKYQNSLYPNIYNRKELLSLLKMVNCENRFERMALTFFLRHIDEKTNIEKLFYKPDYQFEGSVLYEQASDLQDVINNRMRFYNVDFFEKFNLRKKYDIIVLSNILDWARNDVSKIQIVKDNVNRLLKDDGVVICSLLSRTNINKEREIFFDYECQEYKDTRGYTYTKKR